MTYESRCLAGILLVVLPTVMFGGASILSLLIGDSIGLANSALRELRTFGLTYPGAEPKSPAWPRRPGSERQNLYLFER